jgi:2-polyprenyl-3-methyl-5-hydroxy-6-metoxy-1,4-benzoquinol methylase
MRFYFQLSEYVILRVLRRFIFTYEFLLRFGRYIPYYKVNVNQDAPEALIDRYSSYVRKFAEQGDDQSTLRILEVGAGATNSVGLLLADRLNCHVDVYDPYVAHDTELTETIISRYNLKPETIRRVRRIDNIDTQYDFILSNSVLEHVKDIEKFFQDMKNALKADGKMVHFVDYRDHFFKYPYFFLMFSKKTWDRFLNPGDLYRWRIDDHIQAVQESKLKCTVLDAEILENDAEYVINRVCKEFLLKKDWKVATATLVVE